MSLKNKFEKTYGTSFTLSKCREKNCALVGLSKDYFIINGDTIKKGDGKSVDCIIIDLRKNNDQKFKIIYIYIICIQYVFF